MTVKKSLLETRWVIFVLDWFLIEKIHLEIFEKKLPIDFFEDLNSDLENKSLMVTFPFLKLIVEFFEHSKSLFILCLPSLVLIFTRKKWKIIKKVWTTKQTDSFLNFVVGAAGVALSKGLSENQSLFISM